MTAQIARIAFLALIFPVAALVFAQNTWAASGNVQVCNPGANCTIGEFLYNDSYSFITTATCNITSRYPNGTLFLNNVNMPVSAQGDGWYAYSFTTPSTTGLYRTEVKCTTGVETLALDKSFEAQNPPTSAPTANDIAGAVWGYSSRSLSTFGNLVTDIWGSATRTLTGSALSSGSLATKDDLTSGTTITNISNVTNTTNNLLEQLIKKPIIDNQVTEGVTTIELQTKLEKSDSLANQLLTSGTYAKSKTNLVKGKWNDLGENEITKTLGQLISLIGQENDMVDKNSIFGQLNWISEQWDFPISVKLYSQNKRIALALKSIDDKLSTQGKVNSVSIQIKNLSFELDSFIKLVGTSRDSLKSNTLFGELRGQKELLSALDKNYLEATTLVADIGKNSKPQVDLITQINTLSTQVAVINQLPKMNKVILSQASTKMDQKQLKNKTLSLRGIVGANKQFLAQKPGQPLRSFWFEEGSIIFKTLISNPSKLISQKIPLKYYLPKEVTKENITKTDNDLTINYDTEKDQYYVSGNFTIEPGETRTLSVTVDDSVFHINDAEIATIRKQVEELSKPLKNTAYFAQGTLLKSDIDVSLDKVESLQKNNTTPEVRIRSFRESQIEFKAAKEKLEKLKELATNAGSVGTLFGFVGGAQVLAVWGLIIIMVAGFVFLSLYMRILRSRETLPTAKERKPLPIIEDEFVRSDDQDQAPTPKRFYSKKLFRYTAVFIVAVLMGGSALYALGALRQSKQSLATGATKQNVVSTYPQTVLGSSAEKIASESAKLDNHSYQEVNILVPVDSTVTIHAQSSINSPVLTSLKTSKKAKEATRQDGWVKVVLQDEEAKFIEGWVDEDFIQTKDEKPQVSAPQATKNVTVKDIFTGFLWVRRTPGGEEITKVSSGDQYPLVQEAAGWAQIVLEDGTQGWVSKQYVNF